MKLAITIAAGIILASLIIGVAYVAFASGAWPWLAVVLGVIGFIYAIEVIGQKMDKSK